MGSGELLLFFWVVGLGILFVFGTALWLGEGLIGKVVGFIVACGICSPILWPVARSHRETVHRQQLNDAVVPICQKELLQTPGPFLVDGFVDETGGLRSKDIEHFLTKAGFAFVEVRIGEDGKLTAPENYPWRVSRRGGYARLQLNRQSEANCFVPVGRAQGDLFTSRYPVRPETCLGADFSDRPSARHQLTRDLGSGEGNPTQTRWILRDLVSGEKLASFTDAHAALSPHAPSLVLDEVDCRDGWSGYSTLMRRLQATSEAQARSRQFVLDTSSLEVAGIPATISELESRRRASPLQVIRSSDGPYVGDRQTVYDRRTWEEAYGLAERHGGWVTGRLLIRPKANLVH